MIRTMLKSKIHRATVTEANLEYEGSVTIDTDLLARRRHPPVRGRRHLGLHERRRLRTYAIPGEAGSGEICVNGAAAHLIKPHDLVIIASCDRGGRRRGAQLGGEARVRRRAQPHPRLDRALRRALASRRAAS